MSKLQSGIKHAAHLVAFAKEHAANKSLPYGILMEADGGPDHNITHLSNQLALFGIFLSLEIDVLKVFRGCPGLSYLTTAERAMSTLNLLFSCCASKMDLLSNHWLLNEVIKSASSMKAVRDAIMQYDTEFPIAVAVLERCIASAAAVVNNHTENVNAEVRDVLGVASVGNSQDYDVGDYVRKFFPSYGWFEGTITSIKPDALSNKTIRVTYLDGDEEDITEQELHEFKEKAAIPIGEIGFLFIKKFNGQYFSSKVIRIYPRSEKRLCRFNDGKQHQYSLNQIEKYTKLRNGEQFYEDDDESYTSHLSQDDEASDDNLAVVESVEVDDASVSIALPFVYDTYFDN